jgi:hypothetical protein
VVGADGASSNIRRISNIPIVGVGRGGSNTPLQHLINVHFNAPQLEGSLAAKGMLYFVFNKCTVCVVRAI